MCWTRFLKTILDQDSGTNFLNTFLGHVFWTAETERSQNLKIEPQSRHTKPCRKHNRPSITTKKTRQTHSLSLTPEDPVSHPLVSTHHLLLFVFCFCLPLRGLQMPKNLSPHLLLFETTAVPGVCVAHHNNCLLKHSVWCHCWCHPGLVVPSVSCLPLSPVFLNMVFCWGPEWQPTTCVNFGLSWCNFDSLPSFTYPFEDWCRVQSAKADRWIDQSAMSFAF